jgi:hypothetical protein
LLPIIDAIFWIDVEAKTPAIRAFAKMQRRLFFFATIKALRSMEVVISAHYFITS